MMTQNRELKERIERIKIIKLPLCQKGGIITKDAKQIQCPDRKQYVSVKDYCRLKNKGANCVWLKWNIIETKEIFQPDKNL